MSVKLLIEYQLEFLSLKGGCITLVKMSHCWKLHVAAHIMYLTVPVAAHIMYLTVPAI